MQTANRGTVFAAWPGASGPGQQEDYSHHLPCVDQNKIINVYTCEYHIQMQYILKSKCKKKKKCFCAAHKKLVNISCVR